MLKKKKDRGFSGQNEQQQGSARTETKYLTTKASQKPQEIDTSGKKRGDLGPFPNIMTKLKSLQSRYFHAKRNRLKIERNDGERSCRKSNQKARASNGWK